MYVAWLQRGRGPIPDLTPEEREEWELSDLYTRLAEEYEQQLPLRSTRMPETSERLKRDFDDYFRQHGS